MADRYYDGLWLETSEHDDIRHIRAGWYDSDKPLPESAFDVVLRRRDVNTLIHFLDTEGYIKPRLDERLRDEDLKITHRLLDIIGGLTKKD